MRVAATMVTTDKPNEVNEEGLKTIMEMMTKEELLVNSCCSVGMFIKWVLASVSAMEGLEYWKYTHRATNSNKYTW